jgi:hypothetical protein
MFASSVPLLYGLNGFTVVRVREPYANTRTNWNNVSVCVFEPLQWEDSYGSWENTLVSAFQEYGFQTVQLLRRFCMLMLHGPGICGLVFAQVSIQTYIVSRPVPWEAPWMTNTPGLMRWYYGRHRFVERTSIDPHYHVVNKRIYYQWKDAGQLTYLPQGCFDSRGSRRKALYQRRHQDIQCRH